MFLPTKAHVREIVPHQYRIRLGNRVPKDAVNLAYSHIPAINSRENLLITDLSNTVLENTKSADEADVFLHPSASLLLSTEDGQTELPTADILITNIFKGETPLYYAHTLAYYHYDNVGPDEYGIYQGNGIIIVDRLGKRIERPYRIQLIQEPNYKNLYTVIVYTSFKDSESDSYEIVYNAIHMLPDGRTETFAGHRESLNLHKAFTRSNDLSDLLKYVRREQPFPTYYQSTGSTPGMSKFYVTTPPIEDRRTPEFLRYQIGLEIELKGRKHIWTTPWYSDQVFNVNALTSEERNEYINGGKRLTKETAEEIMRSFADRDYFYDARAKKKYFVISDNDIVKVFTRLDGSSPVFATTNSAVNDRRITIPINARRSQRPVINPGTLKFRIRPIRGADNTVANVYFALDISKSMARFDSDKGFRSNIVRDVIHSAEDFHRMYTVGGCGFSYGVFPITDSFVSQVDDFITKLKELPEDRDVTNLMGAIDTGIAELAAIPDKTKRESDEVFNDRFLILVTDGKIEDFVSLDAKIEEARAIGIKLALITFANYEALAALCGQKKMLCIDALSPRVGTFLRYFFFDIAGFDSIDLGSKPAFTISPEEGEKDVIKLEHNTFSIPEAVIANKFRFGLEIALEAHASVSIHLKDVPANKVLSTINSVNIIPINYMDLENVYVVVATSRHYEFLFNHTYAMRFIDNQQVRVISPREIESRYSWHVRVKNGRFERRTVSGSDLFVSDYGVPEYYRQDFIKELGVPFLQIREEKPRLLDDSQIQVRHTPLHILYDGTNVTNATVRVNGKKVRILSWSAFDGIINLDGRVTDNDDLSISYQYEEESYVYRGYYDEASERFWSLDLNPSVGHYITIRDKYDGEIKDIPSFRLINEVVYLYLQPIIKRKLLSDGRENVVMVNRSGLLHSFEKRNDPDLILLAKLHVRPNSNRASVVFTDTRVRGGGLKEEITNPIIQEYEKESHFYWDIGKWDGLPYPENGVAVFRISRNILKDYGGKFTKAEVEEKVNKHLGYGILPIIEFIEDSDELLSIPEDVVVTTVTVQDNDQVIVEAPTFRLTVEG